MYVEIGYLNGHQQLLSDLRPMQQKEIEGKHLNVWCFQGWLCSVLPFLNGENQILLFKRLAYLYEYEVISISQNPPSYSLWCQDIPHVEKKKVSSAHHLF